MTGVNPSLSIISRYYFYVAGEYYLEQFVKQNELTTFSLRVVVLLIISMVKRCVTGFHKFFIQNVDLTAKICCFFLQ